MELKNSPFPHQAEIFAELLATAQAFFSRQWLNFPYRPRFTRLVVGPSGSGKTFLARNLAQRLKLPFWECAATNWIPLGCSDRGARPTWLDVADFVREHEQGVIFLDEVDKLGSDKSVWMTCTRVEIFALLDRTPPSTLLLRDNDSFAEADLPVVVERLAHSFFLIGGGAFQDLCDAQGMSKIGFSSASLPSDPLGHSRLATILPVEIVNRFAPPVLTLPRLELSHYMQMWNWAEAKLDPSMRKAARRFALASMSAAVSEQLGFRWIEQVMLEWLVSQYRVSPEPEAELKK